MARNDRTRPPRTHRRRAPGGRQQSLQPSCGRTHSTLQRSEGTLGRDWGGRASGGVRGRSHTP
eukprot:9152868-Alexandrium_andersonii.AAC.1